MAILCDNTCLLRDGGGEKTKKLYSGGQLVRDGGQLVTGSGRDAEGRGKDGGGPGGMSGGAVADHRRSGAVVLKGCFVHS